MILEMILTTGNSLVVSVVEYPDLLIPLFIVPPPGLGALAKDDL